MAGTLLLAVALRVHGPVDPEGAAVSRVYDVRDLIVVLAQADDAPEAALIEILAAYAGPGIVLKDGFLHLDRTLGVHEGVRRLLSGLRSQMSFYLRKGAASK